MLVKKQAIFAQNMAKLIQYSAKIGKPCTVGEVYRTPEQAAIYAEKGKGIKNSLHCQKLACDLQLYSPEYTYHPDAEFYRELGEYWESLHASNRWGGNFIRSDGTPFVDACHFEFRCND